jgi:DNA topoisomerase VI subunit A
MVRQEKMPKKKKATKKQSTSTVETRQAVVQGLLKDLGGSVYNDLDSGRFPSLTLASRSVRNIVYDKKLQQFILGATTVKKSSGNIKHIRPFTQLVWLAYFAKKLVDEKRTSTLRDVFYSAQAFNVEFQDQAESDELITDLEVLMAMAREGMNIYPEERSAIFGNMTIEYTVPGYEGRTADLSANPDGVMIGPALTTAEFRDTDAEMVLAIEKGGLFTRFTEERVHERYKAILINTAGQPPRSTRYLIRRLNQELGLPVGILCDADPWGAHIAMVIKSGSVQRDEPIVIKDTSSRVSLRKIGEFVDDCIEKYGHFHDSFGNEVCGEIPFEVLSVDANHRVRFMPMSAAIRHHHTGPLYRILSSSGRSVEVTGNHSVFILRDGRIQSVPTENLTPNDLLVIERDASVPRRRPVAIDSIKELLSLSEETTIPELFVHITDEHSKYHNRRKLATFGPGRKQPKLNYHIHTSYISCRNNRAPDMLPARLWLTKEFARLLGYYTSEGRVSKANGVPRAVELSFGLHEPEVVDDAEACIRKVFSRASITRSVDEPGNGINLRFGGTPTALLFLRLFGTGFARKRIPMQLFSARKEHVLEFLKGCFGDGYITNSGGLVWKMKNPDLMTDLAYLMSYNGVTPSIGSDKISLIVSGSSEIQKLVSTVLHDDDRASIISHIASTKQSSYLMPKAFPVISSGLSGLKREIGKHVRHDAKSKNLYRRICEVIQFDKEGATNRENLGLVLNHVLTCEGGPSPATSKQAKNVLDLVESDVSFDPIVKIERTSPVDEHVYDVSVPGVERFIGGHSGLLLHNSANAAHLRELTTPEAVWLGVTATDIQTYKLPSDKLTDVDIKRLYELKADPRYTEKMWHDELETFLKYKRKSEQEAFARYGLSYIVDKYLPEKLELMKGA